MKGGEVQGETRRVVERLKAQFANSLYHFRVANTSRSFSSVELFLIKREPQEPLAVYEAMTVGDIVAFILMPEIQTHMHLSVKNSLFGALKSNGGIYILRQCPNSRRNTHCGSARKSW